MTETDDNAGSPRDAGRRRTKRAALRAVRPFVGYFDRRFQELHGHVDQQPQLERVAADLNARLDQVTAMAQQARDDVASDADTIAELAFTLERFADLFTARMEEIADSLSSVLSAGATSVDSRIVELPYTYAAADTLPTGARVATLGAADSQLAVALASLGLRVTVIGGPETPVGHPGLTTVDEPVERWNGPTQPFDAIFALSVVARLGLDHDDAAGDLDRQVVDLFHKWIRPDGLLVLTVPFGTWSVGRQTRTYDDRHLDELLAEWEIRERRVIERVDERVWRAADTADAARPSRAGVALVRANPRA